MNVRHIDVVSHDSVGTLDDSSKRQWPAVTVRLAVRTVFGKGTMTITSSIYEYVRIEYQATSVSNDFKGMHYYIPPCCLY